MSPESTLSFSLSSPPPQNSSKMEIQPRELLSANISPSIFSPEGFAAYKQQPREKETNFGNLHLFDDSNRLLSFVKENQDIRKNEMTDVVESLGSIESSISQGREQKKLSVKSRKNSKVSLETSLEDSPNQSPDQDLARRLSLESNAEIAPNMKLVAKLTPTAGKKLISAQIANKQQTPLRTTCNCKKSRCLKLYCDCFAVLKYCDSTYCNCVQCCNNMDNEDKRTEAIKSTKEKNLLAFQTKISDKEQHVTGCHCKNSHCLKKYCECFTGAALCGANCKCQSCKNYEGSVDLLKTREASPKADGSGKKKKESPNGVNFLDEASPALIKLHEKSFSSERKSTYSLRQSTKENQKRYSGDKAFDSMVKRRKVKFATTPIVYPFFGDILPETPKLIALKCLDFLSGKDIYTMSQVSSLWNKAAMDDALWE
jgi:hypothetical protein